MCRKECRKIFIAVDKNGIAHAGAYIVWDENSAYYLLAGSDPKFRNSGAMSFCLWEAIKFSSNVTKEFNFEGSMINQLNVLCVVLVASNVWFSACQKLNLCFCVFGSLEPF